MNLDDSDKNENSIPLKDSNSKIQKSNSKDNLLTSPLLDNEVVDVNPFY